MIYATYNLNTLKNHAKQLKRLKKSEGIKSSHMDCMNQVAQLHNAEDWNHLYKAHTKAIQNIETSTEYDPVSDPLVFIEDLTFEKKLALINSIQRQLSDEGFNDTFVEKYTQKVLSTYAPTFSQHFMKNLESADETMEKQQFTSLGDMYGHLVVVSDKPEKHVDFLKHEVIPTCLTGGGLLVISESQLKETKHLLSDKRIRKINVADNAIKTPLKWSDDVDLEVLNLLYVNNVFGFDEQSMHEGRAVAYFEWFFKAWKKIGINRLPPNKISRLGPETLFHMLNMLGESDPLKENIISVLSENFMIDTSTDKWSDTIISEHQDFFSHLTMIQDILHNHISNVPDKDAIPLDTLFDDLSQTTVLIHSDLEHFSNGRHQVEIAFMSGIMNILQERLKRARRDRIINFTPLPRFLLYTAPNSHSVQRKHNLFTSMVGPTVKTVLSIMDKPNTPGETRLSPKDINCVKSIPSGMDEIECEVIKHQATHIIDLGKLSYSELPSDIASF